MTGECIPCEILKQEHKNKLLDSTKEQAKRYAKMKGLDKIVVYERKNGSYSYCERGSEKESYKILEVLFIN